MCVYLQKKIAILSTTIACVVWLVHVLPLFLLPPCFVIVLGDGRVGLVEEQSPVCAISFKLKLKYIGICIDNVVE